MLDKQASDALLDQIKLCLELSQDTTNESKEVLKETEEVKDNSDLLKRQDSLIYGHLSIPYKTQVASLVLINALLKEVDNLAKKGDIDIFKSELSTKINDTLSPIAEEFKKLKELENRGSDIYK